MSNPLKYAGEYYDDESGLYYVRARYYDPTIGRFISRDSLEGNITNPLSLNPYTYVENDPLGYVDPSGHFPIGAIISTVIRVIISAVTGSSSSHHKRGGSHSGGSSSGGSIAASLIGGFNNLIGGKYSDQFSKTSGGRSTGVLVASTGVLTEAYQEALGVPSP